MATEKARGIEKFFDPESIAVAGVSTDPNKLGSIIFAKMTENRRKGLLKARVYALNPSRDRVGGEPCYPSVEALPEAPEMLVIAVPESSTTELVRSAAKAGVKAAVIVSSGYAEAGRGDVEEELGRLASKHGMRILGPNTIGVVDTWSGVDSLFLRPTKPLPGGGQIASLRKPLRGEIAVVSQSGHLGEVILEELAANGVGIRALVGTGNQLDVSVEDMVRFFADDPHTRVVAAYLEGVRDGRRFMQACAYASKKKPLVVFKVGRTGVGARAALTHTASMVGDYGVYRAAFRQSGVVEAHSLQELADYSVALLMLPKTGGKRLAIVTNAGGVGVITADEAEGAGLDAEPLAGRARDRLRAKFDASGFISNAALANPFDLTATASTDDFVKVTESVLALPQYDLGLLLPTHQTPAIDYDIAERLGRAVTGSKKPVCACVIGDSELARRIHQRFMSMGIPTFPTPERAVHALAAAASYPALRAGAREPSRVRESRRLPSGLRKGPLPAAEVSRLLRSYGIREPKSAVVKSAEDLRRLKGFAFPVVCKLQSEGLLHKTDVGGVALGVGSASEAEEVLGRFRRLRGGRGFGGMLVQETIRNSIELIIGGTRDPAFGPVVMVGLGGTYTELVRDYALAVAPVTPKEADEMLARTKVGQVLEGFRGGPKVGTQRASRVLSSFSRMMAEEPLIDQMEVNPLMVTERTAYAVDSRIIVRR